MNSTSLQLASGHAVDLTQYLCSDAISIANVAHQLAQINRYTGAARRPISVAEHSLLVWQIAKRELGLDVHGQLAALLHDAHEIVTGDCSSPLKIVLGPVWRVFEGRWQAAFQRAFSIQVVSTVNAEAIRRADLMALATERRDLLNGNAEHWPVLTGIEPVAWHHFAVQSNRPWMAWAAEFLEAYNELDFTARRRLDV